MSVARLAAQEENSNEYTAAVHSAATAVYLLHSHNLLLAWRIRLIYSTLKPALQSLSIARRDVPVE